MKVVSTFQINLSVPTHRTFTNLKKADWDSYTCKAEESFALPWLPPAARALFRKILNTSAEHHIPHGHIRNTIPNHTETAKTLIIERDALRSSSPSDTQIQELNAEIHHNIKISNRQKWTPTVESCLQKCNPSRLWSMLKSLDAKRTETPPN